MNIALVSLEDNDLTSILIDIAPLLIITSNKQTYELKLADVALQIDGKIYFENVNIDLVCVINRPNLSLQHINNNFVNDYADRVYFTTKDLYTSSFYCKPHIFSLLSNLYKSNFSKLNYQNLQEDSVELLTTKLLHLIYRAGIDVKFA